MQGTINIMTYKVETLFMQKKESGASEKLFEFMPSITLENALLPSRTYMFQRINNGKRVRNDDLRMIRHS